MTAAFDNVHHQRLLDSIYNTNMPAAIRCCLHNNMQNRRGKVHFRQQESKSIDVKTGVIQGGVLSPAVFNFYVVDFPTLPPNIMLILYSDYIVIYISGPVVAGLINDLNIYLSQVPKYINNKRLTVNGLIHNNTLLYRYSHAQVKLADQALRSIRSQMCSE